jgi:hypothetical protein
VRAVGWYWWAYSKKEKIVNRTSLEHAVIAVAAQCIAALAMWFAGYPADIPIVLAASAVPLAFFFGREHAQRQKWLEKNEGLQGWGAVLSARKFWEWDTDSKWDLALPLLAVTVAGVVWVLLAS